MGAVLKTLIEDRQNDSAGSGGVKIQLKLYEYSLHIHTGVQFCKVIACKCMYSRGHEKGYVSSLQNGEKAHRLN